MTDSDDRKEQRHKWRNGFYRYQKSWLHAYANLQTFRVEEFFCGCVKEITYSGFVTHKKCFNHEFNGDLGNGIRTK